MYGTRSRHMVQTETHAARSDIGGRTTREMYLVLYPKELEDEVIEALESTGVPGYTEMPKMVGRGRHTRHFDNAVWPGATGCFFSVLSESEAESRLLPTFRALAANLDK